MVGRGIELRRKSFSASIMVLLILAVFLIVPTTAVGSSSGSQTMVKAKDYVDLALKAAGQGDLSNAQNDYSQFRDEWRDIEETIKDDSGQAYSDIESNMGQVEYAFLQNKQSNIVDALQGLQGVSQKVIDGQYSKGQGFKKQNITLADFVLMLQQTKAKVEDQDKQSALADIAKIRESWLSVEGSVVAQSSTVYSNSERDMVTVKAMVESGNYQGASQLLEKMVGYIGPLASKAGYTLWDAAMIPIREGLEALLVVAALLTFVKRSNEQKGKSWIWIGVFAGLALSAVLAVVIKVVFSSGAFGQNNFLIAGWTGIVAAVMLLYMSYWLHSNSNIARWNNYIRDKSQSALDTGRIVSLGILSFLAVFREGTETVLFIIGMVNQISYQQLIIGILIGLGVLAIVAYLMLFLGVRLPIRPFFLVSSLIVFYLCFKFTGLGIHSLQLAGFLPATTSTILPSIDFLGFFPSWQSAIPQGMLVVAALIILLWKQTRSRMLYTQQ
jgi:high-affinity iron transporter